MLAHPKGIPIRPSCEADAKPEVNFLLRMTTDPAIRFMTNRPGSARYGRMAGKPGLGFNQAFSVLIDMPATWASRDSLGGTGVK
jgi:hypothetical protein